MFFFNNNISSDGLCIFSATGTAVVTSHGLTMSNSESAIESPEGLHNGSYNWYIQSTVVYYTKC